MSEAGLRSSWKNQFPGQGEDEDEDQDEVCWTQSGSDTVIDDWACPQ